MTIVILGTSIAGVKAAERIRQHDKDSQIILISHDGNFPVHYDRWPELVSAQAEAKTLLYQPEDFYKTNAITVICNKTVTRINLKLKRITVEQEEQKENISYDILIVTELPQPKFRDVKGANKTGVLHIHSVSGVQQVSTSIELLDTIALEAQTRRGIDMALAIHKRGKEVYLLLPDNTSLASFLTPQERAQISDITEDKKFHILTGSVTEILGEGDARAVRTSGQKVVASDLIIFEETLENFRLLAEPLLETTTRVKVNDRFAANVEHVYALGPVADSEHLSWRKNGVNARILEEEGERLATVLLDQPLHEIVCLEPVPAEALEVPEPNVEALEQEEITVPDSEGQGT